MTATLKSVRYLMRNDDFSMWQFWIQQWLDEMPQSIDHGSVDRNARREAMRENMERAANETAKPTSNDAAA